MEAKAKLEIGEDFEVYNNDKGNVGMRGGVEHVGSDPNWKYMMGSFRTFFSTD